MEEDANTHLCFPLALRKCVNVGRKHSDVAELSPSSCLIQVEGSSSSHFHHVLGALAEALRVGGKGPCLSMHKSGV